MDLQGLVDGLSELGRKERSRYHLTFGDLINALKSALAEAVIQPKIIGIGAKEALSRLHERDQA